MDNWTLIEEVSQLLEMSEEKFLESALEHILPQLIFKRNKPQIELLAQKLHKETPQMVVYNVHYVLAFLFTEVSSTDLDFQDSIKFLQIIIQKPEDQKQPDLIDIGQLIRSCVVNLLQILAFELGDDQKRKNVENALNLMCLTCGPSSSSQSSSFHNESQSSELASFLTTHFLPILQRLKDCLNPSNPKAKRFKAVKSLIQVLNLTKGKNSFFTPQVIISFFIFYISSFLISLFLFLFFFFNIFHKF